MEELLKIGAAYIRVSDERQDEYSPDSQLKKIREYAAKDGCQIPDEYVFYDDGISGKSTRRRDDFNRMVAIAKEKNHPFNVIYVWKFSRFARNQEESMVYKNLLRKKGVSVISVSEPIPEGHFGTLIERIIEWMDEFYLINLGTEVVRGMTEKVTRGEPTSGPPFGYIMKEKRYYPDEEGGTANIVREVFDRYNSGEGQRSIAIDLGIRGVRTKMGNPPENRWIDYMLNNPVYVGKLRWSQNGVRAVSKRDYHNENVLVINAIHEPIISTEVWEKTQKLLEAQKAMYPKYAKKEQPIEYMMKGLVRCGSCGATLALSSATSGKAKTRTMQCCNYSRGSCHVSHSITIPKIESAFMEGLRCALDTKQFAIETKKTQKAESFVIDYENLISIEERKLARAKEAYLAEIDTLEQYAEHKREISKRIDALIAKRDREQLTKIDVDAFAKKVSKVVEFIQREDISDKAKNEALHTVIDKVIYEKAKGNLAIYFHDI